MTVPEQRASYTAETWPIAAAMLHFCSTDSRGGPIHDAEPEEWAKHLRVVRRIGFTEVDPTDTWVRVGDLTPARLDEFKGVLSDVKKAVVTLEEGQFIDVMTGL
jgi:hypothetical protein